MKSLQVLIPNQKCIFNCPFCISKVHEHDNNFINNYYLNKQLWKNNLIAILKKNLDLKYIVITGTNEPMQSKDCVKDIITIAELFDTSVDNVSLHLKNIYSMEN